MGRYGRGSSAIGARWCVLSSPNVLNSSRAHPLVDDDAELAALLGEFLRRDLPWRRPMKETTVSTGPCSRHRSRGARCHAPGHGRV
jgi:hypothetical protein